jgi:hypothetical protein
MDKKEVKKGRQSRAKNMNPTRPLGAALLPGPNTGNGSGRLGAGHMEVCG